MKSLKHPYSNNLLLTQPETFVRDSLTNDGKTKQNICRLLRRDYSLKSAEIKLFITRFHAKQNCSWISKSVSFNRTIEKKKRSTRESQVNRSPYDARTQVNINHPTDRNRTVLENSKKTKDEMKKPHCRHYGTMPQKGKKKKLTHIGVMTKTKMACTRKT